MVGFYLNPDGIIGLAFRSETGNQLSTPVPLDRFVQYGLWYQKRALPDLDRPAGAGWLAKRLRDVTIRLGCSIVCPTLTNGRVKVVVSNGNKRTVDHVLLGTGYRIDLSKYGFLAADLRAAILSVNGYPILRQGFETSVPRLHLGAPAAWSFGPLLQFVSGTTYTSRALLCAVSANVVASSRRKAI